MKTGLIATTKDEITTSYSFAELNRILPEFARIKLSRTQPELHTVKSARIILN